MNNLRNLASQIALSLRPASDVEQLDTKVDRLLVLNWAQAQAIRLTSPDSATLQDIQTRIDDLRRPRSPGIVPVG